MFAEKTDVNYAIDLSVAISCILYNFSLFFDLKNSFKWLIKHVQEG